MTGSSSSTHSRADTSGSMLRPSGLPLSRITAPQQASRCQGTALPCSSMDEAGMDSQLDFATLWQRFSEPQVAQEGTPCAIATAFSEKIEEVIIAPLGQRPSRGQIAQAKYLLQDEWH